VGNCDPDHGSIRRMLVNHFEVEVDRVMFPAEALREMGQQTYALVLINRLIFADDSDGLVLVRAMQADEKLRNTPIMMISNFADAQARAVADGAVPGFGKATVDAPDTLDRLAQYMPPKLPRS
ncbi:MAG: response regulator, partial [Phycisphaerae bacterium]